MCKIIAKIGYMECLGELVAKALEGEEVEDAEVLVLAAELEEKEYEDGFLVEVEAVLRENGCIEALRYLEEYIERLEV